MSQYRRSPEPTPSRRTRRRSYRQKPVARATMCLLFRTNRSRYRHRRSMLSPFFQWLFGVAPSRTDYQKYRYYSPRRKAPGQPAQPRQRRSSAQTQPPLTLAERHRQASGVSQQPLTLAERHAAKYRAPGTASPYPSAGEPPVVGRHVRRFHDSRPSVASGVQANMAHQAHGNQHFSPYHAPRVSRPITFRWITFYRLSS